MQAATRLIVICTLLLCSACGERNTEYRLRSERGREKTLAYDDLAEAGAYNKNRDKLLRGQLEQRRQQRIENRRRNNLTASAMKDGTLMERYTIDPSELPAAE